MEHSRAREARGPKDGGVAHLARLTVRGFKSIAALEDFSLERLNVLIGANGAGKSNFIGLFRMLAEMLDGRLQLYVKSEDGPDALLFGGRKRTRLLEVELYFDRNAVRAERRHRDRTPRERLGPAPAGRRSVEGMARGVLARRAVEDERRRGETDAVIEVIVVGEGQTEETFVRDVLAPEFAPLDISLQPRLIQTSLVTKAAR